MVDLERVGRPRDSFDEIITSEAARVGDGGEAARAMNQRAHFVYRWSRAGHECRSALADPEIERLPYRRHMARADQCVGDLRPADRSPFRRPCDDCFHLDRQAEIRQPCGELADTPDSICALRGQTGAEARGPGVDEIAEHMDVEAIFERRHFDPGDAREAVRPRRIARGGEAGDGVVVGDAEGADAGQPDAPDELDRRVRAVGRAGVEVEIDHADATARRPLRPGRRRRRRSVERAVFADERSR